LAEGIRIIGSVVEGIVREGVMTDAITSGAVKGAPQSRTVAVGTLLGNAMAAVSNETRFALAGINGRFQIRKIGDTVGVGITVCAIGYRVSQTGVDTHYRDRAGVLAMYIRKFK